MTKPEPKDKYCDLAAILRSRIEFAETILGMDVKTPRKVETACLQGRKVIETISFMCLVTLEHGLGTLGLPRDALKQWNAEVIFKSLKKKNLMALPSPSEMKKSDSLDYKYVFEGVPEKRLSYDELIDMYQSFHSGLHEPNPYTYADIAEFYERMLPQVKSHLEKLRNFTWVHFASIKGEGFMVDLKNTEDLTVVVPVSKTAELP